MEKYIQVVKWATHLRTGLLGLLALMAGTIISGCTSTASSTAIEELSEIRVGYIPDINGAAPLVIGEHKQFFKQAGIQVTPTKFLSGPPEFQAMAAGKIDIAYIGPGATFLAAQGKGKIIAVASLSKGDKLLATKSSGIQKWEDLKGKTVGVPKGTSGEMILNLGLEKAGLKPSDVNIVNLDVAGAVSSFIANKVDAVAIWSPYTTEIERQVGKDNIITIGSNEQFFPEYVFPASWVVNPTFLEEKPELVEKFVQAWIAANDYKLKNIEETIQLTAHFTQVPEDSLRSQLKDIEWIESSKIAAYLQDGTAKKWYENLQQLFVKSEKLKEVVPAEQFVVSDLFHKAFKTPAN
ncbi:ABC transporter substrate-binding protein [Paenibacillus sp. 481]|uniref:ABC transporter substrate-binding protein n=1 Tax=Paenibacillus sp. 481 TaxID=2835869 RepID=UPI001E4894AB|nr:aliphatic sulfonate ABC transporter substrate-binding protein [Paenibacillus sp. 481]UHA72473.1 aliphatic sulfonate ABC transporter substrate-binding protein [Paenibacillus sp. 481]